MEESIYDKDGQLQCAVSKINRLDSISTRQKELILAYRDEMFANGLSKGRVARFLYYLTRIAEWLDCEFEDADLPAIKRLVAKIEASKYVPYSKKVYKLAVRRFYKWLRKTEDYPPEVRWIPMRMHGSQKHRLPEELLTQEDVRAMIEAASGPRYRAMVAVLYESGTRITELAMLKLKHVQFDSYGAQLHVTGKTGSRRVRIISSVPYLTAWINAHPQKNDPNAYLWVTSTGKLPKYNTITSALNSVAARAGVRKRVNPHSFRHSRATHLANHLTEAQMKEYFGWVQGSDMAAVYVHLSGRDVDDALLRMHGVKKEQTEKPDGQLKLKPCPRCRTDNPCTNRFCSLCGLPLDEKTRNNVMQGDFERRRADDLLDEMLEDPAFRQQFLGKLRGVIKQTGSTATLPTSG